MERWDWGAPAQVRAWEGHEASGTRRQTGVKAAQAPRCEDPALQNYALVLDYLPFLHLKVLTLEGKETPRLMSWVP